MSSSSTKLSWRTRFFFLGFGDPSRERCAGRATCQCSPAVSLPRVLWRRSRPVDLGLERRLVRTLASVTSYARERVATATYESDARAGGLQTARRRWWTSGRPPTLCGPQRAPAQRVHSA